MWVKVTVEWSRPMDVGDAGMSRYRVSSLLDGCETRQTSCSVLLMAGSKDKVTVVAENRFGESRPSKTIKVKTPQYRVNLAGSGPSIVTASSLGASPRFYLTWNVYDPAHSINEFDVTWPQRRRHGHAPGPRAEDEGRVEHHHRSHLSSHGPRTLLSPPKWSARLSSTEHRMGWRGTSRN